MNSVTLLKQMVEASGGFACTTFHFDLEDHMVFGRNFDFMLGHGHILINKRNVSKRALVDPSERVLSWTSKYGSLTFNQVGREFPYGGMNEAGLVIEQLWLDPTQYPETDDRYPLSVLQWIQFQLDTSSKVQDIIDSDQHVRILDDAGAKLHFFAADASGDVACIEYLNGEMKYKKGAFLPYPVLTNHTYNESLQHARNPTQFMSNHSKANPFVGNSLYRFQVVADSLKRPIPIEDDPITYAFDVLDRVRQPGFTQWSIVYDISSEKVHFKTWGSPSVSVIQLKDFDFSSKQACQYYNLADSSEEQIQFVPYSAKANMQLINEVFDNIEMLKHIPQNIRAITATYPDQTRFND